MQKTLILLEIYAEAFSVLVFASIPMMSMICEECGIAELAFLERKAVAPQNPKYVPMVGDPYFNFSNFAK